MTIKKNAKRPGKKTTKKKTAKKSPAKKAPRKAPRKKRAIKKFDDGMPSMQEFNNSPAAPWPWPLRPMQRKAYDAMQSGIDRLGLFWHRRAGKDVFGMSIARDQMRKRIGSYVHFFPKHVHAKRALWRGIDPRKGQKFIDIAFGDMEVARNNQDMMIEAYNGSTWTLLGSDNYDSTVIGGNVVGVVFSEWALCDPRAWDYIRPILRENNGWAMFITTFRGRNHAWQMAQALKDNPDWYVDIRTIEQTSELDGSRIITDEDVEKDRNDGMKESLIQQEYYCNPEATSDGAVYGAQLDRLRNDIPRQDAIWNPSQPVYTVWNFDTPIFASCIHFQCGDRPSILSADTFYGVSLDEALAKGTQHPWKTRQHIIGERNSDLMQHLADLDIYPQIVRDKSHLVVSTCASQFMDSCRIDLLETELLLDSLAGYVRRERFDAQVADMQFADFPASSWHTQLVYCLETLATWEYYSQGNQWGKAPDYSTHDRIARTII